MLSYKKLKALMTDPYDPIRDIENIGDFKCDNLFVYNKNCNSLECRLKCGVQDRFDSTVLNIGFNYLNKPESGIDIPFETLSFNRLFENIGTANCLMNQIFEIVVDCKEFFDIADGIKLVGALLFKDYNTNNDKECAIKFYDSAAQNDIIEKHYFMIKGDSAQYTAEELLNINFSDGYVVYII